MTIRERVGGSVEGQIKRWVRELEMNVERGLQIRLRARSGAEANAEYEGHALS